MRARFGQNFFAINGLNFASVVCRQAALSLFIPGCRGLAYRVLVKRNQKHIHKAGSVFRGKCLALFSQFYHLVVHRGLR